MINYKEVVDYLNTLILDDNGKEWYGFEFSQFYSGEEIIKLINLIDCGCDNTYRLYHSTLCDNINTNEDLINCCMEELQTIFDNIKSTMGNILSNNIISQNSI